MVVQTRVVVDRDVGAFDERALEPQGTLVLADLFSWWLLPTLVGGRRGKARTRKRLGSLLTQSGFASPTWHPVHVPLIGMATVVKP